MKFQVTVNNVGDVLLRLSAPLKSF